MNDIDAVRLKTGDKSQIERETATGDGATTIYKLGHAPIISGLIVWVNGVSLSENTNYSVLRPDGVVTLFVAPAQGIDIIFQYYWAVFSDEEVQYFIDDSGGNVTLGAVKLLLSLAADAAKIAMRETMGGGSTSGTVTRDTSLTAQELRETANALYKQYGDEGGGSSFPADGLTEVLWTVHMDHRAIEEEYYREG